MIAPSRCPEDGLECYDSDRTQGPACAIAAGAGTIYRHYFAQIDGQIGQSRDHQIDCLADLGQALGNQHSALWTMRNGYALASASGLQTIAEHLVSCSAAARDALREMLRIGIQWDTEVTLAGCGHRVTQSYNSALPVAYSPSPAALWEPFARLVLEASYDASLCAARLNAQRTGVNRAYLTLLGRGAFGNSPAWIVEALAYALRLHRHADLDVAIVSYGRTSAALQPLWSEVVSDGVGRSI